MARNSNSMSGMHGVQGEERGNRYGRNRDAEFHRDYGSTQVGHGQGLRRSNAPDDERYDSSRYGGQGQYEGGGRMAARRNEDSDHRDQRDGRRYQDERYGSSAGGTYDYGYPVEPRGFASRRYGSEDPMYQHRPFSDFPYNQTNPDRHMHDGDSRYGERRGFWDRASDEVASWMGDDDAAMRREMDQRHRGRGPKNYTRSAERIREDVCDCLSDDWVVDASDVEVTVDGKEVTLAGTVPSRDQRRRAEDLAERISGVTHVQNNIRVAELSSPASSMGDGSSNKVSSAR